MEYVWDQMPDVQERAERHLSDCLEAMDAADWGSEDPDLMESPAYAPFDGCNTCLVREVILVVHDSMMEVIGGEPFRRAMPRLQLVREGDAMRPESRSGDD